MTRFASIAALLLLSTPALAVPIYGGTDLLGAADASLLEQWLGQGPISLTNIFAKEPGDNANDFHAAVDNQGATFSLLEVTGNVYGVFEEPLIIGGYNPLSWGGYGYSYSNYGARTAFIYNLNSDTVAYQIQTDYRGQYQTYNYYYYGPTFGGGHDIYVAGNLNYGYTFGYSYDTYTHYYGRGYDAQNSILGAYGYGLTFGRIEVFTINASAVPVPGTLALLGLGAMGLFRRSNPRPT